MTSTRLLMGSSALVLGLLGILGSFAPDRVLGWVQAPPTDGLMLIVQVLGALFLGFAAVNWMARGSLIGGIYSRPVVVGNLLHFLSAGLAVLKLLLRSPELRALWPLAVVYAIFAASFATLLFRHPVRGSAPDAAPRS